MRHPLRILRRIVPLAGAAFLIVGAMGTLGCRDTDDGQVVKVAAEGPAVLTTAGFLHAWLGVALDGVEEVTPIAGELPLGPGGIPSSEHLGLIATAGVVFVPTCDHESIWKAAAAEAHRAEPVVPIGEQDRCTWLNPGQAAELCLPVIEREMVAAFPGEKEEIISNVKELRERLSDMDSMMAGVAELTHGREVLVEDPRVLPLAERLGLRVRAVLAPRKGLQPSEQELEAFRAAARSMESPIILIPAEGQRYDVSDLATELNMRTVAIDLLLTGGATMAEYERGVIGNAQRVALALGPL